MNTFETFNQYVIPNYKRFPVTLVRGEGAYIWADNGTRYLDLFPGWGCNLLGHCPPAVVEAVRRQAGELIHVPNSWYTVPQGQWAKMLSERAFGGKCFFCNSGTEANEAAIKLMRMYGASQKRYKIITFEGGFHGRTMGSISATAQPKYHEGLGPMLAGFTYAPYNDLEAVKTLVDDETVGILLEPIQGEGGVNIPSPEFLLGLRELCDRNGLLLCFDEVQTGCGRTGDWFGYQNSGVVPDLMTLAKALAGGIAAGALMAKPEYAPFLRPGMHAATFGGNPIAAAAGIATLEMIEAEGLLKKAKMIGERFIARFHDLKSQCDLVKDVRGRGAMIGMELNVDGADVVPKCMERGLLINCTHSTVIRLLPPAILTEAQVDEGCDILCDVIKNM